MAKKNLTMYALASALLAITFGHSFEWWCNNEQLANLSCIDARGVWTLAQSKVRKHGGTDPDHTPTPCAPSAPADSIKMPRIKCMARIDYAAAA